MIDEARRAALAVLQDVLEKGAYANLSSISQLDDRRLDARDRAFASAMIYGTISQLPALDYLLEKVLDTPLAKLQPEIRTLLRLGAWQLYFAGSVPPSAAVDESVKLAAALTNKGASGLVNAVLRKLSAENRPQIPANKPYLLLGLPPELFGYLKKWYGLEESLAIGRFALESRQFLTVRVNLTRTTPREVRESLSNEQIETEPGLYCSQALRIRLHGRSIRSLAVWQQGLITVQDEAAMLVALCAAPQKKTHIIDLCAAPGGKSTHLAETVKDQARILALDVSVSRLALIDELAKRLKLQSIRTAQADATDLSWSSDLRDQADLILADVPCSGLGLLGKKPEIRLTMNHEKMQGLYPIQEQILNHAALLVKPGGFLIYSTCTLNPQENEGRIESFLSTHQGHFVRESIVDLLPKNLLDFPDIAASALQGFVQLLPHRHQTDGFYIVRLRRIL